MKSHDGDIELSVTLDTSGADSDIKKLQKKLESATKEKVGTYEFIVDKKQVEKEVQSMIDNVSKSLEDNAPTITPTINKDEAEKNLEDFNKLYRKYLDALQNDRSWNTNTAPAIKEQLMKQFPKEWEEQWGSIDTVVNSMHKVSDAVDEVTNDVNNLGDTIDESFDSDSTDKYIMSLDEIKNKIMGLYEGYDKGTTPSYVVQDQIKYLMEDVNELSVEEQDLFDSWYDGIRKAREEAAKLVQTQEQMADSSKNAIPEPNVEKYTTTIKEAQEHLKTLASDYLKMQEGFHYSDDFVRLKKDAEYLTKALNSTNEKLRQMELEGTTDTEQYAKMVEKANNLSIALQHVVMDMKIMREDGSAFEEGIDPEQLQQAEKVYNSLASKMALIRTESQNVGEQTGDMTDKLSMAGDAAGAFGGHIGMVISIATKAIGIFKKVGNAIKQVGNFLNKTLITPIKKLASQITRLLNPVKSLQKVSLSFKQMLGYAIGINSVLSLFNKLRATITEGTQNLAKWRDGNNRANESLSTLTSTLQWMKNAWGAAFEPILTYVTPLLDTLISKVAETANAISFMLAKLTGQSTWMKAIRVQKDYAKSLSGTGGAAKDTTQKLAQYDKLVVINQDNANGASSANADIDKMFEEVPIDNAIDWADNILDKLLEAWKKADFSDIGKLIGTRLKEWLDNIDWTSIKQWASKIAKSLATLLNGFFETEGLGTTLGKSLAETFNTAFTFLDDFVHTLHWDSIGKFISETLLGFIDTFDATTAGSAIGGLIRGFIDMIYTALDDFTKNEGFEKIGQKIAEFITAGLNELSIVDEKTGLSGWQEMGESLNLAVHGLITTLSTTLQDLQDNETMKALGEGLFQLLNSIDYTQFIDDILELWVNIVNALVQGLEGFTDTDNLADALIKLIEGALLNAIIVIEKLRFKILEIGIENLPQTLDTLSRLFNRLFDPFDDGGDNPISKTLENILASIMSLFNPLLRLMNMFGLLKPLIHSVGEGFTDLWDNFLVPFSDDVTFWLNEMIQGIKSFFDDWAFWLADFIVNFDDFVIDIKADEDTVLDGLIMMINDAIDAINNFIAGVVECINDLFESVGKIDFEMPEWAAKIGIEPFSIDLSKYKLGKPFQIPRLAQGAVIPPNKEFLAMLGDQKSGVNIETPLDTMVEAFKIAMEDFGSNNNQPIVLQLDGRTIAQAVWDEDRKKYRQTKSYSY